MADDLERLKERARQSRQERAREIASGARQMALDPGARAGEIQIGDRVFDTQTGLEGTVLDVRYTNYLGAAPQREDR